MVRKFKKKDLPTVLRLWRELNIDSQSFIEEEYWQEKYKNLEKELEKGEIFVHDEKGAVRGFIDIRNKTVKGVFVQKEFQSKGIGEKLMKRAKSKNDKLKSHVYKKNEEALHFYLREGFAATKVQKNLETGEEEYLMKWKKEK